MITTILILLMSSLGHAQQRSSLPFDLVKNGVTVLPTQVRFHIKKTGEISIADTSLSRKNFFLEGQGNVLKFQWPSGIFEKPILTVFSSGKKVFAKDLSENQVKLKSKSKSFGTAASLRFCITDASKFTLSKICSEIYLLKNGKWTVRARRKKIVAYINKNKVGAKGQIAVSPGGKPLKLKLTGPTGFQFEGDLKIDVRNFLDLQKTKDGKFKLEFRRASATPDSAPEILLVDATEPIARVKEPGQIPMFQEFILKSLIPTEEDKIYFADANVFQTYSGIVRIRLQKNSADTKLTPIDGTIRDLGSEEVEWQLRDLKVDQTKKAYLSVNSKKQTLMTYAEVTRHPAIEINGHLGAFSTKGTVHAKSGSETHLRLGLNWWFEDFFRMRVHWLSWQRWGYELDIHQAVSSAQTKPLRYLLSSVKYRINRGIHLFNPSYGIKSTFQLLSEGKVNSSALGIGLFAEFRAPSFIRALTSWIFDVPHWIFIDTAFFPLSIDKELKPESIHSTQLKYKYLLSDSWNLDLTYNYKVDKFRVGRDKEINSKISMLMMGMGYRF